MSDEFRNSLRKHDKVSIKYSTWAGKLQNIESESVLKIEESCGLMTISTYPRDKLNASSFCFNRSYVISQVSNPSSTCYVHTLDLLRN